MKKNVEYSLEKQGSVQSCPHGDAIDTSCAGCFEEMKETQKGAWKRVQKLLEMSKFKRRETSLTQATIERDGETFTIHSIEKGDDPLLSGVQKLLEEKFGKEEVDPEEIMRSAVEKKTPWGTHEDVKYKVFAITDSRGEVVSTVAGGHLDLRDAHGKPTKETIFMVAYAVTSPKLEGKGLAREAYISALKNIAADAHGKGKKLTMSAGECTYTSEGFWNRVGWKRVYQEQGTGEKKVYSEAPYIQPALDFNEKTGLPAEDAGEAPEHLMIDPFEGQTFTRRHVVSVVEAFYRWCNRWPKEAFENNTAHRRHTKYVDKIFKAFKNFVADHGEPILLDSNGRDTLQKRGIKIEEHSEADHGDAGKEDF